MGRGIMESANVEVFAICEGCFEGWRLQVDRILPAEVPYGT